MVQARRRIYSAGMIFELKQSESIALLGRAQLQVFNQSRDPGRMPLSFVANSFEADAPNFEIVSL